MDEKTLKALKGSIAKWEAIVAGTGQNHGARNCPLCALFSRADCEGCPVSAKSGKPDCHGTPYYAFALNYSRVEAGRIDYRDSKRRAQAELDFLKSLLPEPDPRISAGERMAAANREG